MSCDNVQRVKKNTDSTRVKKDISECINSIISRTWNLKNARKEIYLARLFLKPVIKHIQSDKTLDNFAIQNATFFYDIMIDDIAKWTVKKEVLKVFANSLCQLNKKESSCLNSTLYTSEIFDKFYIYKLIDLLSVYGDYDFQALIIEVIFRATNIQQLKGMVGQLIPESKGETLREKFSKIDMQCLNESTRDFLNCLNQRYTHIFSICCSKVTLGHLNCEEQADKSKETWVDFNVIDVAISWYAIIQSFKLENVDNIQEGECDTKILITIFKSDVEKIQLYRLEKSVKIDINLHKSCLSSHEEYQPVIDTAKTVSFEFSNSEETNELVSTIMPNMFRTKIANYAKMEEEQHTTKPLIKNNKRKSSRLIRMQTLGSISEDDVVSSDTLSGHSDYVRTAAQPRKILKLSSLRKHDDSNSKTKNTSHLLVNKSVLRDKDVNIPSRNKANSTKKQSVICVKSETDLFNPNYIQESDIDNMSVCFTSEEQLLRMANDFDAVKSFLSTMFPSSKRANEKASHTNSEIHSKTDSCKQMRNVKITKTYSNSVHSSNGEKSVCSRDVTNSTLKLAKILGDGESLKNFAKAEVDDVSDIVKSSSNIEIIVNPLPAKTSADDSVKHVAEEPRKIKKIGRAPREKKLGSKTIDDVTKSKLKTKKVPKTNYNFTFELSQSLKELLNKNTHSNFINQKPRNSFTMDLTLREKMEDTESIKSLPYSLNVPKTPSTPPPAIFDNNDELTDSPFSLPTKKKPVKPISITPSSIVAQDQNSENSDISNSSTEEHTQAYRLKQSHGMVDKFNLEKNKTEETQINECINKISEDIVKGGLETDKNDAVVPMVSYSWSTEALFAMKPGRLCSTDFNGFYLLIIFFHFDIFTCEPTFISEISKIDMRIDDFFKIKSKILLCSKGEGSLNSLATNCENKKKFDNLKIPLIVDDGNMMSSVFKVCSNRCNRTKSFLLLNDKGNKISYQYFLMERELDIDYMLSLISHSQKYALSN